MPSALARAYLEIRGDTSRLPADLQRAKAMLTSSISSMANIAGGILAATGIASFASMAIEGAKAMITFNSSMEQYRISLGVMLKDQERANKLIKDVQTMAAKTPFSTDSLLRGIQLLKSYGFETERLLPLMKTIGNAAAASPQGMESGVHRISIALGQIQAKGHLMTQEMHQLTEAGVPAWEILSSRLNKSVASVMQMVEQRKLSSAQAIEALTAGIDDKFGAMMEKQSQTYAGMWSTIVDNTQIAMGRIGEPVFEAIKEVFRGLAADSGDSFSGLIESIRGRVQMMVELLKGGFSGLKSFFGPIFEAIGAQAETIVEVIGNITRQARESLAGIGEILNYFWKSVYGQDFGTTISDGFAQLMDGLALFTTDFTSTWDIIFSYVKEGWLNVQQTFTEVWETIKAVAMGVIGGIAAAINAIIDDLAYALDSAERVGNNLLGRGAKTGEELKFDELAKANDPRMDELYKKFKAGEITNAEKQEFEKLARESQRRYEESYGKSLSLHHNAKNIGDEFQKGFRDEFSRSVNPDAFDRSKLDARTDQLQKDRDQEIADLRHQRNLKLFDWGISNPTKLSDAYLRGEGPEPTTGSSKKSKIPGTPTGVSHDLKTGTLGDLWKAIQTGVGKKRGEDTLVSAARITIDEKQARMEAYKNIAKLSEKDGVPRAA